MLNITLSNINMEIYLMEKAKQIGLMVVSVIVAVYIYGYATKED